VCLWLGKEQESFSDQGWATHYDTRENQPHRRPEWRLYYPANEITGIMETGDTLFIAKQPGDALLFIVTPHASTIQAQFLWLFGFDDQPQLQFAAHRLTVLAAKSTCKDRWRQILPEAQRIWPKHLITLEPAISMQQTDQMAAERVQLVVPEAIQSSYRPEQRNWLLSLTDFIDFVAAKERA
jgi:hypothetical protein